MNFAIFMSCILLLSVTLCILTGEIKTFIIIIIIIIRCFINCL